MVRGRACLRQRAPASGLDRDWHGDANAGLCRCRIEVAALAHDTTNVIGRAFPACRDCRLRRTTATSARVRSAARGSNGDDRGMPRGLAGGWRCPVESDCKSRLRMVFRRQRPIPGIGRSSDRKLPRWIASRSRQRKLRRRVGCMLSPWSRGDSSIGAGQYRPNNNLATAHRRRLNFISYSSEPRTPCHKPRS